MLRKVFSGLVLVGLGSWLWCGTSAGSYVRTAWAEGSKFFWGSVPIEFEIARAKQLLKETDPQIKTTQRNIVQEEVRVKGLQREIAKIRLNLTDEKVELLSLRDQVGKGQETVNVGHMRISRKAAENQLVAKFNAVERIESTLKTREAMLQAREEGLLATKAKYDEMIAKRKELEVQIESLESQYKMLQAQQVSQNPRIDDSKLSALRQLLESISENLEVEKRVCEEEGKVFKPTVSEAGQSTAEVLKRIDDKYGKAAVKGIAL